MHDYEVLEQYIHASLVEGARQHTDIAAREICILRGGDLIFYRSRGEEAEGNLSDLVHQTAMYYEDRLGGTGFARVVLVGGAAAYAGMESGDWLRRSLEERLRTSVQMMRSDGVHFANRIGVDQASLDLYSPLVGLLLR